MLESCEVTFSARRSGSRSGCSDFNTRCHFIRVGSVSQSRPASSDEFLLTMCLNKNNIYTGLCFIVGFNIWVDQNVCVGMNREVVLKFCFRPFERNQTSREINDTNEIWLMSDNHRENRTKGWRQEVEVRLFIYIAYI